MIQYNGMKAEKNKSRANIPAGGYVEKILDAKIEHTAWGDQLVVSVEVAEGEYTGFFAADYRNNDRADRKWRGVIKLTIPDEGGEYFEIRRRVFNNFIACLEESNTGYAFNGDESTLKGKLIGGLHRNREWTNQATGVTGWTTELCAFTDVESIRSGSFTVPKDKPLANRPAARVDADAGFTPLPDTSSDDLPF